MRKCVVSFAQGNKYEWAMLRLKESLPFNFDGDFLGFTDYKEIGSPTHRETPYAFKPYAIQKARDMGYDLVLWCDSVVYAKGAIEPMFMWLANEGYLFFDNIGYNIGDYTNDNTLNAFNVSRDESFKMKMIMACVMGFNFNHAGANMAFDSYKNRSGDLFKGEWERVDWHPNHPESNDRRCRGHRHDQSVMSLVINEMGLNILNAQQTFFAYEEHRKVMPIANTVNLFSEGV